MKSEFILRPHQQEAHDNVLKTLKISSRTHIVMACGSGKTLTALSIMQSMRPKTVVILVPSLALISQFMKEWNQNISLPKYKILAVCSDKTTGKNTDEIGMLTEKIDFPVSNDADEIHAFLTANKTFVKIIFCTYQSSWLIGSACKNKIAIDLGIFDEAHKTAGYNKLQFGFALADKNLTIKKRLFMTATPRHGSIKKDKNGNPILLYSMDDESIYGQRAYTLGFREAINLGLICDYKVVISVTKNKSNHIFNKENAMQEKAVSLKKAIAESGAKKIITFHSSIAEAEYFAEFLKREKIHENIFHISANMNIEKRALSKMSRR